jgi:hypothetical protein
MNLNRGSPRRDKPKKAFGAYNEKYSNKVDFGDSSIPTEKVYRKKWAEGKSWFWTSIRLIILLAIGFLILWFAITEMIKPWR